MKLFKLTDQDETTKDGAAWGNGVTHGAGDRGALYAYRSAALAALMSPAHDDFPDPLLWEAEGDVLADDGARVKCSALTAQRQIQLPPYTPEQRVEFAIRCALLVYSEAGFKKWAEDWLSGQDRTLRSAVHTGAEIGQAATDAAAAAAAAVIAASSFCDFLTDSAIAADGSVDAVIAANAATDADESIRIIARVAAHVALKVAGAACGSDAASQIDRIAREVLS